MEEYLEQLNPQQREAVIYDSGPSLVIAGAGSGKTRVLTNKIMFLISQGYDPRRILALTFTNKAAREMRERIALLVGMEEAQKLWMGTFHSMFLKILRFNADRIGFRYDFTIYDTADTKSLIKTIIKDLELDEKVYVANTVMSNISSLKNKLYSPSDYARDAALMERDRYMKRPRMSEIYAAYWRRCFVAGAMDFDDILFYMNILLRDNPDVLLKYQEFFQYVLVDEYQDTNFAQHMIISQLSKLHEKLCVVGDDAQSIYSFRGANINNILNLSKQYPNLKVFKLEQNYRSTQNILNAANSLIAKNTQQIPKHIFSENKEGNKIQVIKAYSDIEESFIVANKISEMKMLQRDGFDEFAILYRTNAQSRSLEESLRKRNIPYRIYGGLSFYQRKEIKDALGYFRLTVNPNDEEALKRIINYPARGIGEATVKKIRHAAMEANVSMWAVICSPVEFNLTVNSGTLKKLNGFRLLMQDYMDKNEAGINAYELAEYIFKTSRLITSLYSDNTPENISKQENLTELLTAVQVYVDDRLEQGGGQSSLIDFLSEVSLATDQDKNEEDEMPKVTLMTVHAAKGLEFKNVVIVGVEEDLFPSVHSVGSLSEIEEERRLMYVAITRAKQNCIMTYAMSRYKNGQTHPTAPSRFLSDIDAKCLTGMTVAIQRQGRLKDCGSLKPVFSNEKRYKRVDAIASQDSNSDKTKEKSKVMPKLSKGLIIKHERFGIGKILEIDNSSGDMKIVVHFENVGAKTLLVKFAKFDIIGQ